MIQLCIQLSPAAAISFILIGLVPFRLPDLIRAAWRTFIKPDPKFKGLQTLYLHNVTKRHLVLAPACRVIR